MTDRKDLLKTSQDFVFKRVFGAESHKRVLVCLLNAILKGNPQIDSVELLNTELPKDIEDGKTAKLDIKAKTPDGTLLNIEMQCTDRGEIIHRSAFYQARMLPQEIKKGQSYNVIPNIISIWIAADYKATNRKHHTNEIIYMYKDNEKDPVEIATDKFRTFIIELEKIEFKHAHRADMFSVWMMFIKNPESIPQEFLSIPEVKEAMDELTFLSHDKEFREEYEARQKLINDEYAALAIAEQLGEKRGIEKGIAEGEAIGLEKGATAKAKETAINLLKIGLSIEQISQATGLSINELEDIQAKKE